MEFEIKISSKEYKIYKNIPKFFACRNIKLDNYEKLNSSSFEKKKVTESYFLFNASGEDNTKYAILYLPENSNARKKDKLNNILSPYINKVNVIIIKVGNKKLNIIGEVEIVNGDTHLMYNWKKYNESKGRQIRKLSDEELDKLCDEYYISKSSFPIISMDTHECKYNNYIPGDYVEIIYPTLASCGISGKIYRVV